jgi:hypothetical protein
MVHSFPWNKSILQTIEMCRKALCLTWLPDVTQETKVHGAACQFEYYNESTAQRPSRNNKNTRFNNVMFITFIVYLTTLLVAQTI